MGLSARAALEAEWLDLTRRTLPGLAAERGWPIRADHCFRRVLLDHAFGGCWYDYVEGRPAYRAVDEEPLRRAVSLARAVVSGSVELPPLNSVSLAWRHNR